MHAIGVKVPEKHGADYMAMFLRQLGGSIAASGAEGSGTVVKVRLPLLRVSPSMAMSTPT